MEILHCEAIQEWLDMFIQADIEDIDWNSNHFTVISTLDGEGICDVLRVITHMSRAARGFREIDGVSRAIYYATLPGYDYSMVIAKTATNTAEVLGMFMKVLLTYNKVAVKRDGEWISKSGRLFGTEPQL